MNKNNETHFYSYSITIVFTLLFFLAASISLIVALVYTSNYYEMGNCEEHSWENCWKTCKCFFCDKINKCLDRKYMDKCNGSKTINETCEKDAKPMTISWLVMFGCSIMTIISYIALIFVLCCDIYCDNSNDEENIKLNKKKPSKIINNQIYKEINTTDI